MNENTLKEELNITEPVANESIEDSRISEASDDFAEDFLAQNAAEEPSVEEIPEADGVSESAEAETSDNNIDSDDDSSEEAEEDRLLFSYNIDYNKAEAYRYQGDKSGPIMSKSTIIVCGILVAVGLFTLFTGAGFKPFILTLLLAAAFVGLSFAHDRVKKYRYYKDTERLWKGETKIDLYNTYASYTQKDAEKRHYYDEFYRYEETETRAYLIAGNSDIVILDKNMVPLGLIKEIENIIDISNNN